MPALTQFCDIFGAINEQAFNNFVTDFQNQRPSLFNYGTVSFVNDPSLLCDKTLLARVDPDVAVFNNPIVSPLPLLGIPGYSGPYGFEYCFQFSKLAIDFQPSNTIQLPAGLNPPLANQAFALQATLCAALDCPGVKSLAVAANAESAYFPLIGSNLKHEGAAGALTDSSSPTIPFPFNKDGLYCFCLDVFAVLHAEQSGISPNPFISLVLDGIEIPGIAPLGLERSLECYVSAALVLGILPKVKLALSALTFNVGSLATIAPTPISANVPFNPSIESDQIEVFLTLN